MIRGIRFALAIPALVWGGIVNLFLLGNLLAPTETRLFLLMNHLVSWITLASLLVFALAFALRASPKLTLWLLPGAAAFVWWYASVWLPKPVPEANGTSFTVMTFNILGFRTHPEDIIPVIQGVDADLVALEEIRPSWPAQLDRQLTDTYPYQVHEVRNGSFSVALLSRFPILESEYRFVGPDDGRHLRAEIELAGQHVVIYVIHPPAPAWNPRIKHWYDIPRYYDEQRLQAHVEYALGVVKGETLPTLVLCDCNTTPRSRQYKLLDSVLDETFGAVGWGLGFTHPVDPFPLVRIDYVWYSPEFATLNAKVWPDSGTSDHHPMWARLVLRLPG